MEELKSSVFGESADRHWENQLWLHGAHHQTIFVESRKSPLRLIIIVDSNLNKNACAQIIFRLLHTVKLFLQATYLAFDKDEVKNGKGANQFLFEIRYANYFSFQSISFWDPLRIFLTSSLSNARPKMTWFEHDNKYLMTSSSHTSVY